jgi:Tfp pilus assembly protein PilV
MRLRSQTGFSLIESLVACALLATALLSIGHVATAAMAMLAESRVRTIATLLAIAKLEDLRTSSAPADGSDTVDGNGQPAAAGVARLYDRRWSVARVSPDVQLLSVVITPFPRGVAGRDVRITGGWTQHP